MEGYLIFHLKRKEFKDENVVVYHDMNRKGNQDPYIWNQAFLHTYCHITQMTPEEGHINFWVSSENLKKITHLYCDLVFAVQKKTFWQDNNLIDRNDPMVESDETYNDHYRWAMYDLPLSRGKRFTLKADPVHSFQPQTSEKKLVDILPYLLDKGITMEELYSYFCSGWGSRPMPLEENIVRDLYSWLEKTSSIMLKGDTLERIRKCHPELAYENPSSSFQVFEKNEFTSLIH